VARADDRRRRAKRLRRPARAIDAHTPDIAFLDIQMPGPTGLEVAQGIEGARTRVVFVTAFDEYALQAFEPSAHDDLLKPVKAERLARTIDKIKAAPAAALKRLLPQSRKARAPLRWIRASVGELTHQIDMRDALCFEADEKATVVRTTAGAEHLIRTPIVELLAQLDGEPFWQIRSCA
jgi:DNA-binding LytR/AlgR family response regulator